MISQDDRAGQHPGFIDARASELDVGRAQILIVDDDKANIKLLRKILADAGYEHVSSTSKAKDVPRLCAADRRPDLLILDLQMPDSSFEVLDRIRELVATPPSMPVLVVTAEATTEAKHRALALGASDFLTKPVDPVEMLLRTGNLLSAHRMREHLNELVELRTAELEASRLDTLYCLALAAELRDDDTGQHTLRVGHCTALVAAELGLDEAMVRLIRIAAPLHDVGKIGIPDAVLLKPGSLTDGEMAVMRTHVDMGAQILCGGSSPELALAQEIALYHHERWDGTGYSLGLAKDAIPIAARVTAIADTFDALTHARPYKDPWPLDRAIEEIIAHRERQFDPDVVDAFVALDHEALI